VTQPIPVLPKLARLYPLHPALVVAGILVVAASAKLGHELSGITLLLAFYPAYVAVLAVRNSAAPALARLGLSRFGPGHVHARVPAHG
jgi:hypothetical protein